MKHLIQTICFTLFAVNVAAQADTIWFYSISLNDCIANQKNIEFSIISNITGYSFVQHLRYSRIITREGDTISYDRDETYGPYLFKRAASSMKVGIVKGKGEVEYRDYYPLRFDTVLTIPYLMTSPLQTNIQTLLVDSMFSFTIKGKTEQVYKFFEKIVYSEGEEYRFAYISRTTLLPLRYEYLVSLRNRTVYRILSTF